VVGAGCAGLSCAWSLSRFPEKFEVDVWEALPEPGGVATSCSVKLSNGQSVEINDQVQVGCRNFPILKPILCEYGFTLGNLCEICGQVSSIIANRSLSHPSISLTRTNHHGPSPQGGAPSYHNNLMFFKEFGFDPHPVKFKVCFGKGDKAWTNHSESLLVRRLRKDIRRFGRALKWINRLEPLFIFVSIDKVLRLWRFSAEFGDHMVYPLTALFFGTGNQTPNVSAAVVARVFLDKKLALFDYCNERLLNGSPTMFAFPNLADIFSTIVSRLQESGVTVSTSSPVRRVVRKNGKVYVSGDTHEPREYDDIVFTCDMETTLNVLEKPSWLERKLLGAVRYYDDYIVTHEDHEYMEREYEMNSSMEDTCPSPSSSSSSSSPCPPQGAVQGDMYFIRTAPEDSKKCEMSFNLAHYQPHLASLGRPVYQTIFLDAKERALWTEASIDPNKILKTRWCRQFAHTVSHFTKWVPWGRFVQGRKNTWYAGAVTCVNTHEIATISGLACAHRLGAPYPYSHDPLALAQMKLFLRVAHGGVRMTTKPGKLTPEGLNPTRGASSSLRTWAEDLFRFMNAEERASLEMVNRPSSGNSIGGDKSEHNAGDRTEAASQVDSRADSPTTVRVTSATRTTPTE